MCLGDAYEVEEDKTNPFDEAAMLLDKAGVGWRKYEPIVLIILGEPMQLLNYLKANSHMAKGVTDIIQVIIKLIDIDAKGFHAIVNNPAELKKFESSLAVNFVSPIINYIKSILGVIIKEWSGDNNDMCRNG